MRDPLRRVADLLLPGAEDVDLGVALGADPATGAAVRRALEALAGAGAAKSGAEDSGVLEAALAELARVDPVAHRALLLVVSAAHYADPRVREAVGYDGPLALELPAAGADADLDPLIARVRARGPRYRDVPPS